MQHSHDELSARLEELARQLRKVEKRLDDVEERLEATPRRTAAPSREEPQAASQADPRLPDGFVSLVGRTLIVLGGAYLLRAITESGLLPPLAGGLAGLAYAAAWLLAADRAAAAGRRASAIFHALGAALIAYPLLWEATARLGLLTTTAAASALVVFYGLSMTLAWRHQAVGFAWTSALLAVAVSIGLVSATRDLLPFTITLLLYAALVERFAVQDRWRALRWPVALAVDLMLVLVALIVGRAQGLPEGYAPVSTPAVVAVQLALPVLYLTSFGLRTLVRRRPVSAFGVGQACAAVLIGFGGALRVTAFAEWAQIAIGVVSVVLGLACYAVAFVLVDWGSGRGRNFYAYTTFAGLLIVAGLGMVLSGAALGATWCALAVLTAWLGGHHDRSTLRYHSAVYLVCAAGATGLLAAAADGLVAKPAGPWSGFTPISLAALLVTAACYLIFAATRITPGSSLAELLPRAAVGALVAWSTGGLGAAQLAVLAAAPGPAADAALLATGRTLVVVTLAATLGWAGRRWSLAELNWLVYTLLVLGGLKLLAEDLRHGRAVTLFVSLALYGGALAIVPRLTRERA